MDFNFVQLIAAIVSAVTGFAVIARTAKTLKSDYERRDTVEIRRKGSTDSVTISVKGSKQDAKKLVDFIDRSSSPRVATHA